MKIRTSLLVASLALAGTLRSVDAEITTTAPPSQVSTRMKNLEAILYKSGLYKDDPVEVKVLNGRTALISTYVDRRLSDKETKLLALRMGNLILNDAKKIVEVRARFYDPASTKYWEDIVLNTTQIRDGSKSPAEQESTLSSVKLIHNFGLVDGPNLEARVGLYTHIRKLARAGVDVEPFLSKFSDIEKAEDNRQNIYAQLAELDASLIKSDPIVKPISSGAMVNGRADLIQESLNEACNSETAALQAVQEAEKEQNDLVVPGTNDLDALTRYDNDYEALQRKIDAALATLHEARQCHDLTSDQLMRARNRY